LRIPIGRGSSDDRSNVLQEALPVVDFIGIADIRQLLRRVGVGPFIERLAGELEADYGRWSDFEKTARLASHSRDGVIELMPTSDGRLYAFKYVNGHPKNTRDGLLTVTAFGVLADVASGYPLLLSELTLTTALRTAAMSALAARWMARPGSRTMALIGNGAQSEFQAIAFRLLVGIDRLRLYDVDAAASAKLARNLASLPDTAALRIDVCASTEDAVRGADIVTTATADKRNAVILTPELLRPGMHLNAVGGDCPGKTELHADILHRPDLRIVVEYEPQSRIEGEIQQLDGDVPVIEFAQVVTGHAEGRRDEREITLFDSVGFALEDYTALRFLHGLLQQHPELRRTIDLLPSLADPKDLYGGVLGVPASDAPLPQLRRVA
jgi:ornithine cyclodeaminase